MRSSASPPPGDHARLRPSQQLVRGEADHVGAGGDAAAHRRLVAKDGGDRIRGAAERSRAEVVDHQAGPAAARATQSSSIEASSVKPTVRKFEQCTLISATVSGPTARS